MLKLIFIYNANSGVISATKDYFHKILSPNTYECQLCKVTYGLTGMHKEWKKFIEDLPYESFFYHIDEFESKYPNESIRYPSVVVHENNTLVELISPTQMKEATNVNELIELVSKSLPRKESKSDG